MERVRVRAAMLVVACLGARVAAADPSERDDRSRLYHGIPVVAGASLYLALELVFKEQVTPQECRWCESNALDTAARDGLRWQRVRVANSLSNLTGYLASPVFATSLLVLTTADEPDLRRWYDDTVPVLQAGIVTGLLNQTLKIIAGRRRPFATFGGVPIREPNDWHTSFFSGHTALAFTMATSSGMVASLRGYRSAAALWSGGLVLATATGYLRIAADAHYFTDVITGAVIGAGVGMAIPLLFHRDVLTDDTAVPRRRAASDTPFIVSFGSSF